MSKPIVQRLIAALIVATVFTASFATLVSAAVPNAPFAQTLRAKQVRGTLTGGQFAKIWLGLEPEQFGDQITVISEWDRADAAQNGVGFFILDEQGLPGAIAGEALNNIAMAAGTANFVLNGPSNILGASFNAFGLSRYTIIVYNDSNSDANFTLTATNGFISDDSGQVTDPNASQVVTTTVATEAPAPAAAPVTTTTVTTTTVPAPAVATTATTSTTPVATTTTAPVAVVPTTQLGAVSAAQLQGDLPAQNDQHFLGLKPTQRDAEISLSLTFDPQDSSELARRLNFWVLDQAGFAQFQAGANPSEVAIAAGNRTLRADTNERVANFKAVGEGEYVVLVYNTSQVPGSYTISAVGGLLSDDSGQTRTAQLAAVSNTAAATTTTTTTTAPVATTAPATAPVAATTTTTTTATTAARTGAPGGTYTVKAGDTIALIARDIYGDYQLYQQICTFNGLANCNAIEIGDVINLPTQAQITSGATQPAAVATPVATATRAAATSATTTTTTTTTAANPVASTTTATRTTTVAPTTAVTRTGTITPTTTATTTSGATGANIVDTAIANGGFKTLVAALDATGLDATLRGPGPFTVFAPTDAAFAALPAGALDRLLADPTGQLTDILRYHVITNELTTADLSDDLEATTVQGKPVKFDVQGNTIQINGATILTKDIQTSNGVIQVIDAVIIPPAE